MPNSEGATYKYGDIVYVEAGNEDGCPDGLAVVIFTEETPEKINLWVLSDNKESEPIDFPDDSEWSIHNPPTQEESPLCWVVAAHNVKGVDNSPEVC